MSTTGSIHLSTADTLKNTFVQALGIAPETGTEQLVYRHIPQWDSMAHMILVQEIETAFNVMLSSDEVIDLSSYHKALEILAKHGIDPQA
jgi:acyl carrier protein